MPTAFYKTKKSKTFCLTGNKIAKLLKKAIWKSRLDTAPDDLKKLCLFVVHDLLLSWLTYLLYYIDVSLGIKKIARCSA
jgi:hypothetical protein